MYDNNMHGRNASFDGACANVARPLTGGRRTPESSCRAVPAEAKVEKMVLERCVGGPEEEEGLYLPLLLLLVSSD